MSSPPIEGYLQSIQNQGPITPITLNTKVINIETPENNGTRNQTSGDYTLVRNSQEYEMNTLARRRPPNLYDHSPYADKQLAIISKKTETNNKSIHSGLNSLRKRRGQSMIETPSKPN